MKKIVLLLIAVLAISCSGNDEQKTIEAEKNSLKEAPGNNKQVTGQEAQAMPSSTNVENKPEGYDVHNFPFPPGKGGMNRKPPTESQSYYQLGITYAEKGNYKTAIKFMDMAIKADPRYEDAYIDLSNCYGMLKDYKMNIEILNKVLTINPNNTKALHNLVITYEFIGDNNKANEYKEKLKKIEGK